jgi:hypothetical protein
MLESAANDSSTAQHKKRRFDIRFKVAGPLTV